MNVLCDQCWDHLGTGWILRFGDLPYPSLNTRRQKVADGPQIKAWRQAGWAAAKEAKVPRLRPGAVVQMHFYPGDNRHRDRINLALVHKAVVDGVVEAGVLPDDSPEYVDERMPVIHRGKGPRRWELHIVGSPV